METQGKPQVLVVDDEHTVADTLAMVLNISGFQATSTYSGEQAVQLMATQRFDYMISDVVMAGLNGFDVALAVRQIQPQCRVLLISGNNYTTELLQSANSKGHRFEILAKPVHPLFLLEILRKPPKSFLDSGQAQTSFHPAWSSNDSAT